jgi:hypothetical protein
MGAIKKNIIGLVGGGINPNLLFYINALLKK